MYKIEAYALEALYADQPRACKMPRADARARAALPVRGGHSSLPYTGFADRTMRYSSSEDISGKMINKKRFLLTALFPSDLSYSSEGKMIHSIRMCNGMIGLRNDTLPNRQREHFKGGNHE